MGEGFEEDRVAIQDAVRNSVMSVVIQKEEIDTSSSLASWSQQAWRVNGGRVGYFSSSSTTLSSLIFATFAPL